MNSDISLLSSYAKRESPMLKPSRTPLQISFTGALQWQIISNAALPSDDRVAARFPQTFAPSREYEQSLKVWKLLAALQSRLPNLSERTVANSLSNLPIRAGAGRNFPLAPKDSREFPCRDSQSLYSPPPLAFSSSLLPFF